MFCPVCGNNCADDAQVCGACGYSFPAITMTEDYSIPQTPANPYAYASTEIMQSPAPVATTVADDTSSGVLGMVKEYMKFIVVAIAAIALILAIFNFGGQFDISATVTAGSRSETGSGPVSEIIESGEKPMILIGNLLFGFANLFIAAVGALYFLKELIGLSIYDDFIAKFIKLNPLFLMGVVGAVAALLQILCYAISGESTSFFGQTVSYSFGVNWTTWVFLLVYAGIAAADIFLLNKKQAA